MTVLGFIAALVQGLAWPVVILVLALVFRSQVKGLLSVPVQRLKAGPVEVVFGLKLAESETLLQPLTAQQQLPAMPSVREELKQLAEVEPGIAVVTAHDRMYERLKEMVGQQVSGPLPGTAAAIAKLAGDRGILIPELVKAVEEVTVLRNLVARAGADSVTPELALQYLGMVDRIVYLVRAAPYISAATAATAAATAATALLQPPPGGNPPPSDPDSSGS